MSKGLRLPKLSMGVGDRFARQAKAQLAACVLASDAGVEVVPVWNKSSREHMIIGSEPSQTRIAADAAVKELGWTNPYFLDADHINLKTVGRFLDPCDFFTLDVADMIGQPADTADVAAFVARHPELLGTVTIPHIEEPFKTDAAFVTGVANKFLAAVQDAGRIYQFLLESKGVGRFVAEVSMDETDSPQTPAELLIVLAAIADEKIPIQTIAPKFTGRFNKGVDYVGDVAQFTKEFNEDLAAIAFAVKTYGLPENLKLSIHSGSDKFSIYRAIHEAIKRFDAGVHLKTAGTTWLEELIGLAEAGGPLHGNISRRRPLALKIRIAPRSLGRRPGLLDRCRSRLRCRSLRSDWHGRQRHCRQGRKKSRAHLESPASITSMLLPQPRGLR